MQTTQPPTPNTLSIPIRFIAALDPWTSKALGSWGVTQCFNAPMDKLGYKEQGEGVKKAQRTRRGRESWVVWKQVRSIWGLVWYSYRGAGLLRSPARMAVK